MEAGNELGTVKNQTILTKLPGVRKIPGQLKDIYDQICDEKERLQQFFITENKVKYYCGIGCIVLTKIRKGNKRK